MVEVSRKIEKVWKHSSVSVEVFKALVSERNLSGIAFLRRLLLLLSLLGLIATPWLLPEDFRALLGLLGVWVCLLRLLLRRGAAAEEGSEEPFFLRWIFLFLGLSELHSVLRLGV